MSDRGGSYIGVEPRDVEQDRVATLKLKEDRGVEVLGVDQDSPAAKAGLKRQDVILSFNGAPVESVEQLRRMLRETPHGRSVKLGISRDGQPMTMNVQLGERSQWNWAGGPAGPPFKVEIPPMPPMPDIDIPNFTVLQFASRNGVVVEDITPQLGDYFGVKSGDGVLVRSVEKGSPAEAAGLKAGDVIVKVGSDHVACSSDWRRAMRDYRKGGTVSLGIVRDRREQTITMKVPERQTSEAYGYWSPDVHIDMPEINFDQLNLQLEKLRPEIDRSMQMARADIDRARPAMERAMKLQRQQLQKEMEQLRRDLEEMNKDFQ
jgi:predicted metalloprotease with PDZ domain